MKTAAGKRQQGPEKTQTTKCNAKTGEVFVIPDPELRLDQLEEVQAEVGALLG